MIVVVPCTAPVTTPVLTPTVAIAVDAAVHVPPGSVSLNAVVEDVHTVGVPIIAAGSGFTVTTLNAIHPVGSVYVIVAVPPAPTPEIIPPVPAMATAVLLLDHVPPPGSVNIVVEPEQTVGVPPIGFGKRFIVTVLVAVQPVTGNV